MPIFVRCFFFFLVKEMDKKESEHSKTMEINQQNFEKDRRKSQIKY